MRGPVTNFVSGCISLPGGHSASWLFGLLLLWSIFSLKMLLYMKIKQQLLAKNSCTTREHTCPFIWAATLPILIFDVFGE